MQGSHPLKYRAPKGAHHLVAVDLGKTKLGVSVWAVSAGGKTRDSEMLATFTYKGKGSPASVAEGLVQTLGELGLEGFDPLDKGTIWVCEWPLKYPSKTKFHASIDSLHAVHKAITVVLGRPFRSRWTPGEWKGTMSKQVHHQRLMGKYTDVEETRFLDRGHDAVDAGGIGLFAVGRTRRGGLP